MKRVIDQLICLEDEYPTSGFLWQIPKNCPITIPPALNNFEQNVYLKENLQHLLTLDTALSHHYWVIQEWGQIKSFKRTDKNDRRISQLAGQLQRGRWTRESFNTIASLSKVASFQNHLEYAIYDARAVYTLNWLLFKWGQCSQLFPAPMGRNPALTQLDQTTIFALTLAAKYSVYSYKNAYSAYCEMLKTLAEAVYGNGTAPYRIEMLLFRIAPRWTVKDMRGSISVSVSGRNAEAL